MKMGAEFWVEHVAAAVLETIPASEYARRHGLSVPALYYWQRKLRAVSCQCCGHGDGGGGVGGNKGCHRDRVVTGWRPALGMY